MGSFYSTCSITGMTLSYQRVARLLLLPSGYWDSAGDKGVYDTRAQMITGKGLMVSNDGCQGLFCAVGFPIFGKYYDYGRIESIEMTPSVKLLEDFFNISIEDILAAASDDRWITYGIIEYEAELEKKNKGLPYNEHRLNDSWRPKWIDKAKHLDILKLITFTDVRAEIYEEMGTCWSSDKYEDKFSKKILKEILAGKNQWGREVTLSPSLAPLDFMKEMAIDRKVFKDEISNLFWFIRNLGGMYRFLMPSGYGGQTRNFKLIKKLNTLSNKLIKKDIEYYDDMFAEDDDEEDDDSDE